MRNELAAFVRFAGLVTAMRAPKLLLACACMGELDPECLAVLSKHCFCSMVSLHTPRVSRLKTGTNNYGESAGEQSREAGIEPGSAPAPGDKLESDVRKY